MLQQTMADYWLSPDKHKAHRGRRRQRQEEMISRRRCKLHEDLYGATSESSSSDAPPSPSPAKVQMRIPTTADYRILLQKLYRWVLHPPFFSLATGFRPQKEGRQSRKDRQDGWVVDEKNKEKDTEDDKTIVTKVELVLRLWCGEEPLLVKKLQRQYPDFFAHEEQAEVGAAARHASSGARGNPFLVADLMGPNATDGAN